MNYNKMNDFELLYLVNDDDTNIDLLLKKYIPLIKTIIYEKFSSFNGLGADFDDFLQEGIMGLLHAIKTFKESKNVLFYTYALICIKSRINSFYKKLTSNKNILLNNALYNDNILSSVCYNSEFDYLYYKDLFINFKNSLKDCNSLIFELNFNGFNNKEIAILLDLPDTIVSSRLYRIRKKLLEYNCNL